MEPPPPASQRPMPAWFGAIFMGVGAFIILIAADVIRADPAGFHAPRWVVGLCGAVFMGGGVAVSFPHRKWLVHLAAGTIVAGLGTVGAWVAFFGAGDQMSGGFPFLPPDTNVLVGRFVFGFGAACCFLVLIYAVYRGLRSLDER